MVKFKKADKVNVVLGNSEIIYAINAKQKSFFFVFVLKV